ncbi:MAG: universal stress protein [Thermodesulfobacteriota bacterium]
MPHKILIPLDGSKLGEAALHHVEELISALSVEKKIEITLLQVLKPPTKYTGIGGGEGGIIEVPLSEQEIEPIKKKVLEYLDEAAENLRSKGVAVVCKVVVNPTGRSSAEDIIEVEDAINADLVAMSTHGRHGLSRWIFGSVTEKVLQAGKIPVLVVRAEQKTPDVSR